MDGASETRTAGLANAGLLCTTGGRPYLHDAAFWAEDHLLTGELVQHRLQLEDVREIIQGTSWRTLGQGVLQYLGALNAVLGKRFAADFSFPVQLLVVLGEPLGDMMVRLHQS